MSSKQRFLRSERPVLQRAASEKILFFLYEILLLKIQTKEIKAGGEVWEEKSAEQNLLMQGLLRL